MYKKMLMVMVLATMLVVHPKSDMPNFLWSLGIIPTVEVPKKECNNQSLLHKGIVLVAGVCGVVYCGWPALTKGVVAPLSKVIVPYINKNA